MKNLQKLVIAVLLLSIAGCFGYKRVHYNGYRAIKSPNVVKSIESNDVYVHDKEGEIYKVDQAKLEDDNLYGNLVRVEDTVLIGLLNEETDRVKKKDERLYVTQLYTKKSIKETQDSLQSISSQTIGANKDDNIIIVPTGSGNSNFVLHLQDVESLSAYAADSNRTGSIILIIVASLVALLLFFWVLIVLLTKGTESSSEYSGNSSNESSGNSNESSGNSSGGDGSCYIATMSYGSYDAPEVLVLRSFRDRFLQQFHLGRKFIAFYYANAPKFVDKHKRNYTVHRMIRFHLNAFVWVLKKLNF